MSIVRALGLLACGAALLLVVACGKTTSETFRATDVTGAPFGRVLKLTDHTGKPRSLEDFKGKIVAVFFGYVHCPDVCPTTMALLREVKEKLGADGDKLQVLFVTVDPERDTEQVLSAYVPAFDPSFLGMRGDADATAEAAREFKVLYAKVPGSTPTSYSMDHTSAVFVFDGQGRLRLFCGPALKVDDYVHDIRLLLAAR
jgi:protein SCO1/2